MKNPVVHFEIPANDVARARAFYEKTFGWKIEGWNSPSGQEYFMVYTRDQESGTGIDGGLMKRVNAGQPFMNYVGVESIDSVLQSVQANGGQVALPKQEIAPGMGWIAAFIDPEGNIMGLHENARA